MNDMKFTTAKQYMDTSKSELEILLERAHRLVIGRYLSKEEETLVDLLKSYKRIEK
jgi:hypothetical protein